MHEKLDALASSRGSGFAFMPITLGLAFLSVSMADQAGSNSGSRQAETPVARIFRISGSKPELVYDSRQRNVNGNDRNVTLPLKNHEQEQNKTTTSTTEYVKFRYYFECSSISGSHSRSSATPVEWIYEGGGMPRVHIANERVLDPRNPLTKPATVLKHVSTIWIYSGDDQEEVATGQYTCRSITNSSVNTTFHAFFSGKREFMLDVLLSSRRLRSDQPDTKVTFVELSSTKFCSVINLRLAVDVDPAHDHDNWAILPCSVTKPYFQIRQKNHVLLYKVNSSSGEWTFLPANASNLQFDPRIGFRIHNSLYTDVVQAQPHWNFPNWPRSSSYFLCASNNVKTLINITLTPARRPSQSQSQESQSVPLIIEYNRTTNEFTCIDFGGRRIRIGIAPCYSRTHCQFVAAGLQNYLQAQGMTTADDFLYDLAGPVFKPRMKAIEYEFMDSGLVYCWNPRPRLNTNSKADRQVDFKALGFYKLRNGSVWIEGQHLPSASEILQVGILPAVDNENGDPKSNQILSSKGKGSGNGSDSITFFCEGSRLFVAEPLAWTWRPTGAGRNATVHVKVEGKLAPGRKTVRSSLTLTRAEVGDYETIEAVECHVPIWNSGEWMRATVSQTSLKRATATAAAAKQNYQNSAGTQIRRGFASKMLVPIVLFAQFLVSLGIGT